MSALCLSLLFACQPVVFSRGLQDERSDFWWSKGYPGHPNDIDYGRYPAASGARSSAATPTAGASWSYSIKDAVGPPNWSIVAPACGGLYQSPINIVTKETLFVRKKVPLELDGLRNLPSAMTVENEGTSVKFEPHWSGRTRPTLRGGPLRNKYIFEQLHFHWGPQNTLGSEHSLDGQKFPLEVHLVFYNGLYDSFDEAKRETHGLVVVAFFYEVVPNSEDYSLNRWTSFLPPVRRSGSELELSFSKSFSLNSVIGAMGWPYYSYEGSLTTPPCLETVTWIVASKRLAITEREMNLLRSLDGATGGPLLQNYRPTQPVNNRRVFRY